LRSQSLARLIAQIGDGAKDPDAAGVWDWKDAATILGRRRIRLNKPSYQVFSEHSLPMSLYTDPGSHYFRTTKVAEIDRGCPAQVGRALAQLGVEHIGAFSPQARGRSSGRSRRCRIGAN